MYICSVINEKNDLKLPPMRKLVHNQRPYSALVCLVLLVIATCMGGDLYAQTTISTDVIASGPYGDVTIDAGVTFTVSSEVTITGNLNNNGGTIIVGEGGVLTVTGNVTNTSAYSTTEYTIESDNFETYDPSEDPEWIEGRSSTSSDGKTQTQTGNRSRTKIVTNRVIKDPVFYTGSVIVSSGGSVSVEGDFTNSSSVSIETTNENKISKVTVDGSFINSGAVVKESVKKITTEVTRTDQTQNGTRTRTKKWKDWGSWGSWSNESWIDISSTSTDPVDSDGDAVSASSYGSVNLSNGYLTVNNLELKDGSTVNYKTDSDLSTTLNGESVDVESTVRVKGDMTQAKDAVITLESGTTGTLIVAGTFTDNTLSEENRPWKITTDNQGEKQLTTNSGFDFYVQKYVSAEITNNVNEMDDLLAELNAKLQTINGKSLEDYLIIMEPDKYNTYKNGYSWIGRKYTDIYSSFSSYLFSVWGYLGSLIGGDTYDEFLSEKTQEQNDAIKELQITISNNKDLQNAYKKLQNILIEQGIKKTDISDKSSTISSLLPIELTYFSASENGDVVDFAWETSSEYNNDFYTIEYSRDGSSWSALLEEDGAGTTSDVSSYSASASAQQFSGLTYFRLKQTDFNGEYSYSDVTTVAFAEEQDYYVYPNPAEDVITISGAFESARIIDIHQRTVLVPTEAEVTVSGLPAGVYHVVLITENGKKVIPFIKK